MTIAFCSVPGTEDVRYWSGTPYFMAKYLRAARPDFVSIGPLQIPTQAFRDKSLLYQKVLRRNYLCELEPLVHQCLSLEVERLLRNHADIDLIVSPGCFPYPNAFLNKTVPVVFWGDATFAGLKEIFPQYQNLCDENIWCGEKLQLEMLERSAVSFLASEWAASSAIQDYGTSRAKVAVIPFGANLHITANDEAELDRIIRQRGKEPYRLLFIARDWHQKRGDFALAVLDLIRAAGINAVLTIAGCVLPPEVSALVNDRNDVFVEPNLSKDGAEGERAYTSLLASSHLLLHPNGTTCFGMAICEANAWALPALAQCAGGVGSVLVDGENGFIFSPSASAADYASAAVKLFSDHDKYEELCRSSWRQYKTKLNWKTAVDSLCERLKELAVG